MGLQDSLAVCHVAAVRAQQALGRAVVLRDDVLPESALLAAHHRQALHAARAERVCMHGGKVLRHLQLRHVVPARGARDGHVERAHGLPVPLGAVVPLGDALELGQADGAALVVRDDLLALGALGPAGPRSWLLLFLFLFGLDRLARPVVVLENVAAQPRNGESVQAGTAGHQTLAAVLLRVVGRHQGSGTERTVITNVTVVKAVAIARLFSIEAKRRFEFSRQNKSTGF